MSTSINLMNVSLLSSNKQKESTEIKKHRKNTIESRSTDSTIASSSFEDQDIVQKNPPEEAVVAELTADTCNQGEQQQLLTNKLRQLAVNSSTKDNCTSPITRVHSSSVALTKKNAKQENISRSQATQQILVSSSNIQIIRPAPLKKKLPTTTTTNTTASTEATTEKEVRRPRSQSIQVRKEDDRNRRQCTFPKVRQQHHYYNLKNNMEINEQRNISNNSNGTASPATKNYYHPKQQQRNSTKSKMQLSIGHENESLLLDSLNSPNNNAAAPLFERIHSEEMRELKVYQRIIDTKNQQISELETIQDDLETRLECETRSRIELETKLDLESQDWQTAKLELEKEVQLWKSRVQMEKNKNGKLLEEINKKDKEIHRMMQRKYDSKSQPSHPTVVRRDSRENNTTIATRNLSQTTSHRALHSLSYFKSPQEILAASGSGQAVRERNVANSLLDFFGM